MPLSRVTQFRFVWQVYQVRSPSGRLVGSVGEKSPWNLLRWSFYSEGKAVRNCGTKERDSNFQFLSLDSIKHLASHRTGWRFVHIHHHFCVNYTVGSSLTLFCGDCWHPLAAIFFGRTFQSSLFSGCWRWSVSQPAARNISRHGCLMKHGSFSRCKIFSNKDGWHWQAPQSSLVHLFMCVGMECK